MGRGIRILATKSQEKLGFDHQDCGVEICKHGGTMGLDKVEKDCRHPGNFKIRCGKFMNNRFNLNRENVFPTW